MAPVRVLDSLDLASLNGGGVAVRKDASGDLVPEGAIYRAILAPTGKNIPLVMRLRGSVVIDADRASILARLYRRGAAIFVREMGF
jgi:putative peptide zinc metalloprotease protein